MPVDTKELIAQAARTLLLERHVKKLTVKDIVEECHITRQAFYYHFEDIPELLRWMIEKYTEQTLPDLLSKGDAEDGLRCFFVMSINALPYVKQGMSSIYREELERLLRQCLRRFFAMVVENKRFYAECTNSEIKIILRYHSEAIWGLFQEWTEEDTEQLDQIVHTVYRLTMEGISPQGKSR